MASRKLIKCWICKDQGLIFYQKQIRGYIYDMACRCSCKKGMLSSDRIPIVDEEKAEYLAMENYEKYGVGISG